MTSLSSWRRKTKELIKKAKEAEKAGKTDDVKKIKNDIIKKVDDYFILEMGTRRIAHFNVTAHPTADWTLQQFREVITGEQTQHFLIHDRDSIYSTDLDTGLKAMGLRILKTPFRAPQANAFCERFIGTVRRECLDFLIPLNERHLKAVLQEWVAHYNRGRPHSSLGPGIPDPEVCYRRVQPCGHHIPMDHQVVAKAILGRLHHEYRLERYAA
jgi:putative transposase